MKYIVYQMMLSAMKKNKQGRENEEHGRQFK